MQSVDALLVNYYPILLFLLIAGVVAVVMVGGSRLAAPQRPYPEKLSSLTWKLRFFFRGP